MTVDIRDGFFTSDNIFPLLPAYVSGLIDGLDGANLSFMSKQLSFQNLRYFMACWKSSMRILWSQVVCLISLFF